MKNFNLSEIMIRAWVIYYNLTGTHREKLSRALRMAWAEAKSDSTGEKVFEALPVSVRLRGMRSAPKEDREKASEIVSRFLKTAKTGEVYKTGNGFGSQSGEFEIVDFNRSPNRLGIRSGRRTIALSRTNAIHFLNNGAALKYREVSLF